MKAKFIIKKLYCPNDVVTYYFKLITASGDVIAVSELYNTIAALNNGIAAVRKFAPIAEIENNITSNTEL